jgi:hypothetical protein
VQEEVRHGSYRYGTLLGGNIPELKPRPAFDAHVRVHCLAVGEEPRPQARVFDVVDEHSYDVWHGRSTPARPARLWSVLTVHGLVERNTTLGQAAV